MEVEGSINTTQGNVVMAGRGVTVSLQSLAASGGHSVGTVGVAAGVSWGPKAPLCGEKGPFELFITHV